MATKNSVNVDELNPGRVTTIYGSKIGNKKNAGQTKDQGNGTEEGRKDKATQTGESGSSYQVKKTKDLGNILKSPGIILVVLIACIFVAVFIATYGPEMKSDLDLVTIFENGVDELQQSFTNQTERFWMILKNRGFAHLTNKHPTQPLVFLLAAPPTAHEWVDCRVSQKLRPKT